MPFAIWKFWMFKEACWSFHWSTWQPKSGQWARQQSRMFSCLLDLSRMPLNLCQLQESRLKEHTSLIPFFSSDCLDGRWCKAGYCKCLKQLTWPPEYRIQKYSSQRNISIAPVMENLASVAAAKAFLDCTCWGLGLGLAVETSIAKWASPQPGAEAVWP